MKFMNGKSLYIQKKDLDFINGNYILPSKEDEEFVIISDQKKIDYLNSLGFIIDFKNYQGLKDEEIIDECYKVVLEKKKLMKELRNTPLSQMREKYRSEISKLDYKINSYSSLLGYKSDITSLNLFLIKDEEGIRFNNRNYIVEESIDERFKLLSRLDQKPFKESEGLPRLLIWKADKMFTNENNLERTGLFFTNDKKYLVLKYGAKVKEEKPKILLKTIN